MSFYRSWIEINAGTLGQNVQTLRQRMAPGTRLIAVVKANAYGHGLIPVSQVLAPSVDGFAVFGLDEALALRKEGIVRPVLLLGRSPLRDAHDIVEQDFNTLLDDVGFGEALSDAAMRLGKHAHAHVKFDTGMGRQGIAVSDAAAFLSRIQALPGIAIEGICTHFANADDLNDAASVRLQLHAFRDALTAARWLGIAGILRHAAASAAALYYPETHFDAVRIGMALYGIAPNSHVPLPEEFQNALSWRTNVMSIRTLAAGSRIGYGLTEVVSRDTVMALLPVGYADGYDRRLSSLGNVLVRGKRAKILGKISMNLTAVDVTDIFGITVGDHATLIGRDGREHISVEELANVVGTIPYEIVSRIPAEFSRVVVQ